MWSEPPKCGLQLQKLFRRTWPTFLQLMLFRTGEHRYQHYMKDCDFRTSWLRKGVCRVQQKDHVGNRMHLDVQKSAFGASFSAKRSVSRFILSLSFFCLCGHAKNLALAWMVIMKCLWNAGLICCSKSWTRTWTLPAAISHFSFQGDCMGRAFPFGAPAVQPAVQVCYWIFVPDWSYRGPPRISNKNTPKSKPLSEPFLQPLKGISSVG